MIKFRKKFWSSPPKRKEAPRARERERETKRERREPPTMSSGVVPNDACKPAFDKVRLGKIKYVTFKIDDKAEKTEVCEMGETKVRATSTSRDVRRALWGLRNDRRETEGERESPHRDVCGILRTRENGFGFCSRLSRVHGSRDLTFCLF
jgi:hypothetical protein